MCTFGAEEVQYLGYTLNKEGIKPMEDRVTNILNYPKLKSVVELRRFLGIINFYR